MLMAMAIIFLFSCGGDDDDEMMEVEEIDLAGEWVGVFVRLNSNPIDVTLFKTAEGYRG